MAKKVTAEEVKKYRDEHQCSTKFAMTVLYRKMFSEKLYDCSATFELADLLREILDFEFGGYKLKDGD